MTNEGYKDRRTGQEGSNELYLTRLDRLLFPYIFDVRQGIKWLRKREEANGLNVIQLTQRKWLNSVEAAITNGNTLIIENIAEEIDPTLDPVLARAIYKKGR